MVPQNKTLLKSYFGLVTYIKFIPKAADILKPLYMLLRNEVSGIGHENTTKRSNKF